MSKKTEMSLLIDFSSEAKALLEDFCNRCNDLTQAIATAGDEAPDSTPEPDPEPEKPKSKRGRPKKEKAAESTAQSANGETTLEELRAALADYMKICGAQAAKSLVANHGIESLTKCPPEKYAAIAADLGLTV